MATVSPAKMIHHNGALCQWFDMSPRQSLESPDNRPPRDFGTNEDIENVAPKPNIVKHQAMGDEKKVLRTAKAKARPTNTSAQPLQNSARLATRRPGTPQSARATGREQVLPCMRPATPTKSRRAVDAGSPSPSASRSALTTPEHSVMYDDPCNSSVCFSEMSCSMSCSSRLSQLSRRSTTRRVLSTEELIQQKTEEKKRELARRMRTNERNAIKSRVLPENCTGRYERSTRVTVPKEFNLSVGTPRSDISDSEDSVGSARKSKVSSTTKKPWRPQLSNPQLTVPRGPSFLERQPRRSISCPPKDEDRDDLSEMSVGCASVGSLRGRAGTPDKRPGQPTRGATPERKTGQPTRAATERRNGVPVRSPTPEGQKGRAATPEKRTTRQATPERRSHVDAQERVCHERAERARQAAVAKNDEQVARSAAAQKDHRALFRKSPVAQTAQTSGASEVAPQPKVLQRRPSFGSSASRPCCSTKK